MVSIRSRRQVQSPIAKQDGSPLIVQLSAPSSDDPSGKARRPAWITSCYILFLVGVLGASAAYLASSPNAILSGLAILSGCNIQDCKLSMVTLMQNGTSHPCKNFCASNLQWRDGHGNGSPDKLYGSFQTHGVCSVQQELSLKKGEGLIPRLGASTLPDFTSLILHGKMKGKTILMIGDSLMKQAFDILPIMLSGYKETVQHYAYSDNGAVYTVGSCGLDFATKTMSCRSVDKDSKDRFFCNCTTVTTLKVQSTTINFAWTYGVEYQKDSKTVGHYGDTFNIIRPGVIRKLLQESNAVVLNLGVLPSQNKQDKDGYADFLDFVKRLGTKGKQKIIYRLTMPQHFPTKNPLTSYQDVERLKKPCVEVAQGRHWTDTMAQSMLTEGVDLIDMFPIAATQGRFHSQKPGDCNQWCLGYDLFYTFWDAIVNTL